MGVSVAIGTAFFVVPGLILATLFCFYGLAVAERGDIGVFEAIDWSLAITAATAGACSVSSCCSL